MWVQSSATAERFSCISASFAAMVAASKCFWRTSLSAWSRSDATFSSWPATRFWKASWAFRCASTSSMVEPQSVFDSAISCHIRMIFISCLPISYVGVGCLLSKLGARLLAKAAHGVRIQTSLKNHKWATKAKEWPTHSSPQNKIYKKLNKIVYVTCLTRIKVPFANFTTNIFNIKFKSLETKRKIISPELNSFQVVINYYT